MRATTAITYTAAVAVLGFGLGLTFGLSGPAMSGEITKGTQYILLMLKLDGSIISCLDQELTIPKSWIAKAKKEGRVKYIGTIGLEEWSSFSAPFKARYPYIKFG